MGQMSSNKFRAVSERFHIMAPCLLIVTAVFMKNQDPLGLSACAVLWVCLLVIKVVDMVSKRRRHSAT